MAESCPKGQVYNVKVGKCVKKKSKLDTTRAAEQYKKNLSHQSSDKALSKRYVRRHTLTGAVQGAGISHAASSIAGSRSRGKHALGGAIAGGIIGNVAARIRMKKEKKKREK